MLAGTLAAPDERYASWAKAVGVEIGGFEGEARDDAIAELDALVAHLYGLGESDVRLIFETFHTGWDYRAGLEAVLAHFSRIATDGPR